MVLNLPIATALQFSSSCCGDHPTENYSLQLHNCGFATLENHNINIWQSRYLICDPKRVTTQRLRTSALKPVCMHSISCSALCVEDQYLRCFPEHKANEQYIQWRKYIKSYICGQIKCYTHFHWGRKNHDSSSFGLECVHGSQDLILKDNFKNHIEECFIKCILHIITFRIIRCK